MVRLAPMLSRSGSNGLFERWAELGGAQTTYVRNRLTSAVRRRAGNGVPGDRGEDELRDLRRLLVEREVAGSGNREEAYAGTVLERLSFGKNLDSSSAEKEGESSTTEPANPPASTISSATLAPRL